MPRLTLPEDPAALAWTGDPADLPPDIYEWALDTYAELVAGTRGPRSSVLAAGRMATEAARMRRWPRWHADVLGDTVALLCQRICDETIAAID